MGRPVSEFNLSRLERVISGPGTIDALASELERRNLSRAILVTGKSLGDSPLLGTVVAAAGPRCKAIFKGATQHVPWSSVYELKSEIELVDADCLVSFGGGSPIDLAKVAIHVFLPGRKLVHIAVPTTLSAAEYTHVAGVTGDKTLVKSGIADPSLQPVTVINDAALTLNTPVRLWASTGIRALDHAIESIYAIRRRPISDTLGAKAISLLMTHLPVSISTTGETQLVHRGVCQTAAWFSIFGAMNTRFGLSHLLGHQIGPRWNIPHGITSCITLPHAMRFMAKIAPERFGPIAEGLCLAFDPADPTPGALACADRIAQFIDRLNLPHTLKSAGVPRGEIEEITGTVVHELDRSGVIDRRVEEDEIAALLQEAY
jgi:alcohol dehydrogenase class IV